jgi:hypothetical protein
MTGLNTYARADGRLETVHMHEVGTMLANAKNNADVVHAELAKRLGFPTVEAFLAVNGENLKKAAAPETADAAA